MASLQTSRYSPNPSTAHHPVMANYGSVFASCFLCGGVCSSYCPDCGVGVCGEVHMEYHKPPGHDKGVTWKKPEVKDQSGCHPFRLMNGSRGRYLVATRDILPLELVMTDQPLLTGPAAVTKPLCLECLSPLEHLEHSITPCTSCQAPLCSPSCQGGPNHRPECQLFQKHHVKITVEDFSSPNLMYAAIFPLRMLMLRKDQPSQWQKLNFLQQGDWESLRSKEVWRAVVDIIRNKWGMKEVEEEDVLRMIGVKVTNANSMEGLGKNGAALYPAYDLMNSYCYCNTRYTINKHNLNLEVRAQRLISKGSEITTRYVIPTLHQPVRQRTILTSWAFQCTCPRCLDPTELGSYCSAIRCPQCLGGYLVPSSPLMLASPWLCDHCGNMAGEMEVEQILLNAEKMTSNLHSTEDYEWVISNLEKILHWNHLLLLGVKQRLLVLYSADMDNTRVIMDRQLQLGLSILEVMNVIDPGLTNRRGNVLKLVLEPWMVVARNDYNNGVIKDRMYKGRIKKASSMMKEMVMCLNPGDVPMQHQGEELKRAQYEKNGAALHAQVEL